MFWGMLWLVFKDWNELTNSNKLGYVCISILFNPFSPFYFTKLIWAILDIVCGIYLLKVLKQLKIPLYKV